MESPEVQQCMCITFDLLYTAHFCDGYRSSYTNEIGNIQIIFMFYKFDNYVSVTFVRYSNWIVMMPMDSLAPNTLGLNKWIRFCRQYIHDFIHDLLAMTWSGYQIYNLGSSPMFVGRYCHSGLRTQEFFIQHKIHNEILQNVVCFHKDNNNAS